ncbi:MAG: helix-turn-helix domain-containing protein [Chloroflexota bacterium]|nr:helix-turn-helix domain-containing protein [Chloroflexota bacterium]
MSTATRIGERTNVEGDRATVTVEEAGRILGVGRGTAYEAARRGELPVLRLGRRLVVPVAALDRLLARDSNLNAA